jgi:hypothetical protein
MALIFWFTQRRGGAEGLVPTLREALSNNFVIKFQQADLLLAMRNSSAPLRLCANQKITMVQP